MYSNGPADALLSEHKGRYATNVLQQQIKSISSVQINLCLKKRILSAGPLATIKMTKRYITILITLISLTANAQEFSKKDFAKTDWFANNLDSLFYTSDTIRLIKHMNKAPEWANKEYAEYEMKYLEHGDYLNFRFKKSGKFEYSATYNNYVNSIPLGLFSWKFDKADNTLKVFRKEELFFELTPISSRIIQIESRFVQHKDLLQTEEWIFLKIKTGTNNGQK